MTGWQAWLVGLATAASAWLVLALVVFVLIGAAMTAGAMLLLLLPVALVVALLRAIARG